MQQAIKLRVITEYFICFLYQATVLPQLQRIINFVLQEVDHGNIMKIENLPYK